MPTIFDQANTNHDNSGTISDGVTIAASGVRLTNTSSGRIYGGVSFTTGGSTLINELGGVLRLSEFDQSNGSLLVAGSDGADTVVNAGLIGGVVAMGGGADLYIDRSGTAYGVDLGGGNDVYRTEGSHAYAPTGTGGDGFEQLVMAGTGGQHWGSLLSGFEQLVIERGGYFHHFNGFQSMTMTAAAAGIRPVICRQERVGVHMAAGCTRVMNGKPAGVFAMQ